MFHGVRSLYPVLVAYRHRRKPHRIDVLDANSDVGLPRHVAHHSILNLEDGESSSGQKQNDPDESTTRAGRRLDDMSQTDDGHLEEFDCSAPSRNPYSEIGIKRER